jgi:hypothetical protein
MGVDDIDLVAFVKEVAVDAEPVVAGRLHANDDDVIVRVVRVKIPDQGLSPGGGVLETKGLGNKPPGFVDERCFVMVFTDVDTADDHNTFS